MFGQNYDRPAKEYKEAPTEGIGLYFYLLGTYFWQMIGLNLLYLLFCLPIVTIPAATAASCRVYSKLVRKGYCLIFQEYFTEFKSQFLGRLFVSIMVALMPVSAAAYCFMLSARQAGMGLFISFSIASFVLLGYFFPICALIDLPPLVNLKNAAILTFLEWRRTLLMLITAGLWYAICAILFPYTLPLFFMIAFSAGQLMICMCAVPAIERRLVATAGPE